MRQLHYQRRVAVDGGWPAGLGRQGARVLPYPNINPLCSPGATVPVPTTPGEARGACCCKYSTA